MGGPPGFQPPQQAQKKGAPVALIVGGGCGVIAMLAVILLVVAVVVGGSSASASESDGDETSAGDSDSKPSPDEDVGDVMAGAIYKRIPSTDVEVPVPPGWREDRKSLYSFAIAGDGNAMLAFTTVSSLGEFVGRSQHAEKVFRITDCNMQDAQRVRIGPNKLRARLKEGDCTFNGVPAHVATVLVETGRRALPFIIYATDKKASKTTITQAQQTIARMRLR
jgi:hypothetical protein